MILIKGKLYVRKLVSTRGDDDKIGFGTIECDEGHANVKFFVSKWDRRATPEEDSTYNVNAEVSSFALNSFDTANFHGVVIEFTLNEVEVAN